MLRVPSTIIAHICCIIWLFLQTESKCPKLQSKVMSTSLKGLMWHRGIWSNVSIDPDFCRHDYPNVRQPGGLLETAILDTDNKNFVIYYSCLDGGKINWIQTDIYTTGLKVKGITYQIEKAHKKNDLIADKITWGIPCCNPGHTNNGKGNKSIICNN